MTQNPKALHHLISYGNLNKLEKFLNLNTDININKLDKNNYTALQYALIYNHLDVVNLLISRGAKIFEINDDGLIHKILGYNNIELLKFIINNNVVSISKLMDSSIRYNLIENIPFLIDYGHILCIRDLYNAMRYNKINIFKLLLNYKIDLNDIYNNKTILQTAIDHNLTKHIKIILKKIGNITFSDLQTIKMPNTNIYKFLLANNIKIIGLNKTDMFNKAFAEYNMDKWLLKQIVCDDISIIIHQMMY